MSSNLLVYEEDCFLRLATRQLNSMLRSLDANRVSNTAMRGNIQDLLGSVAELAKSEEEQRKKKRELLFRLSHLDAAMTATRQGSDISLLPDNVSKVFGIFPGISSPPSSEQTEGSQGVEWEMKQAEAMTTKTTSTASSTTSEATGKKQRVRMTKLESDLKSRVIEFTNGGLEIPHASDDILRLVNAAGGNKSKRRQRRRMKRISESTIN